MPKISSPEDYCKTLWKNKIKQTSSWLHLLICVNWMSDTKTNYLIKHYSMRTAQ